MQQPKQQRSQQSQQHEQTQHPESRSVARAFRIAAVPGVTLTKWTRAWAERFPHLPLEVVRSTEPTQLWAVREGEAEVAFVRSQQPDAELSMITLYDESPVVVVPSEHPLAELPSVRLADLADENHLTGNAPDTVELVAANVGVVVVPHSIARLHARKDVATVPVSDAAVTPISIAWVAGSTDARIEEFVGIVRGRTARSSRSGAAPDDQATKKKPVTTEKLKPTDKLKSNGKPKSKRPTPSEARAAANRRKRQGR